MSHLGAHQVYTWALRAVTPDCPCPAHLRLPPPRTPPRHPSPAPATPQQGWSPAALSPALPARGSPRQGHPQRELHLGPASARHQRGARCRDWDCPMPPAALLPAGVVRQPLPFPVPAPQGATTPPQRSPRVNILNKSSILKELLC